jgi:hypothetical protein
MPNHNLARQGEHCWIDLMTTDADRSREFYGRLFGWTAEPANEELGGYFYFTKDGFRVAGAINNGSSAPDAWSVYLYTDDAAKTVETVEANGGKVLVGATPVGDPGTMAYVTDPGGAGIGMWQPNFFHGFEVVGEPGAAAWFELRTRDYDATVDFYRNVFGWDARVASDTEDNRYTTNGPAEDQRAGIQDASDVLHAGARGKWSVYFAVDDIDAAVAMVAELGGDVISEPEDTPYGRLATVTDPTGAAFKLIAQSPAR